MLAKAPVCYPTCTRQCDITCLALPRSTATATRSPLQHSIHRTMSDPVTATLPAGPYVIRNRETSTVVHIQHPDAIYQGTTSVQACQQDEGQFKDQQIWWVEPLAEYDTESGNEVVYSITSPGSGKSLEGNPESGNVMPLIPWWVLTMCMRQGGSTRINTSAVRGRGGYCGR